MKCITDICNRKRLSPNSFLLDRALTRNQLCFCPTQAFVSVLYIAKPTKDDYPLDLKNFNKDWPIKAWLNLTNYPIVTVLDLQYWFLIRKDCDIFFTSSRKERRTAVKTHHFDLYKVYEYRWLVASNIYKSYTFLSCLKLSRVSK